MLKEINIPDWVQKEQFNEILAKRFHGFKEIGNFKVVSALNHGENYLTDILRVEIDMKTEDESVQQVKFILKIPLESEASAADNEYHDLFVTEADMYANIIPDMESVYASAGQRIQFKPMHFEFSKSPASDYILMEDLQPASFAMANRLEGLDEEHTKCVLAKLAQWHAASVKRVQLKGSFSDEYRNGYFIEEHRQMIEGMNSGFEGPFLECLENYRISRAHKEKIRNYMVNLTDLYLKFGLVHENSLNVLNHGDFWMNNFMFQHGAENEKIEEILFVDFQLPKYGSPAQDLFCFLMTSPKMEIKLNKFDEFIRYYHEKLLENFCILKCTKSHAPELQSLHKTLERDGLWAFVSAQRMLAVALLDPSETSNIEAFMSDSAEGVAFKKRMLNNPRYVQQIEQILPWLIQRNYLADN